MFSNSSWRKGIQHRFLKIVPIALNCHMLAFVPWWVFDMLLMYLFTNVFDLCSHKLVPYYPHFLFSWNIITFLDTLFTCLKPNLFKMRSIILFIYQKYFWYSCIQCARPPDKPVWYSDALKFHCESAMYLNFIIKI